MNDRATLRLWRSTADESVANLGLTLQLMRKAVGLSLRATSERSGVRVDVLQRAERGTWVLTADQLEAVLDALVAARQPS